MALLVVLCVVIKENKILLIHRNGGVYHGMHSLPGGKVETGEQIADAAVREIKEEAGLDCAFDEELGSCYEEFIDPTKQGDEIKKEFMLHICKLHPKSDELIHSEEGEVCWFSLSDLEAMKEKMVPSDHMMIQKFILEGKRGNYDSIIEVIDGKHVLKKFEKKN